MLHKIGIPLARFVLETSLKYLKAYNPHSARVVPLAAKAPVFMLHTGASLKGGGVDHIKPWIPVFEAAGPEYIVVTRSMDVYEQLCAEYPSLSVSLVKGSEDVDTLLQRLPSLVGFFYVANTANNNLFLRCSVGRHVFLGHGDSDKSSSMNRAFKVYDEIYVAGQAHIDRFANAEFDTTGMAFRVVGRPDTRHLLAAAEAATPTPARIVYVPTWEGYCAEQNYSSLAVAGELLAAVLSVCSLPVIGKLHPLTGAVRKEYLEIDRDLLQSSGLSPERLTFVDRHGKLTELLGSDAIYICDVSAAVSECLSLDRPIFVYLPPNRDIRVVSGRMSYADYAYVFRNADELVEQLQQVLGGNDTLAPVRRRAREYFISPSATLDNAFGQALQALVATVGLPAPASTVDAPASSGPSALATPELHCNSCGSSALVTQNIACAVPKMRGLAFDFTFCQCCGFVSNPDNTYDYAEQGFTSGSRPEVGTRAGDGVQPRREYFIAEMVADILGRRNPARQHDLLLFGAGLSRDHELVAAKLPFARVALSDVNNFQQFGDFVSLQSKENFDAVVTSEVIEHFTDIEADFRNLFSKIKNDGLVVASTNIHDGTALHKLVYPFGPGHVSYHSGRSLQHVARRFGMTVDFRTPSIALSGGGPRKRYVFFYRDPAIGECIAQYFADHHLAPSE